MSLYSKIILSAVFPLVLMLLVLVAITNSVIRSETASLERADALRQELVLSKLDGVSQSLAVTGAVLAGARDSARAVQQAETDFLYEWSRLFHSDSVSKIIFTDLDQVVLSRSDDEYSFGDNLGSLPQVQQFKESGAGQWLGELDDGLYLMDIQPVNLYGQIPVGMVLTAVLLDQAFWDRVALGSGIRLVLHTEFEDPSPMIPATSIRRQQTLSYLNNVNKESTLILTAFFTSDSSIRALLSMRAQLILLIVATVVILPLIFFLLMRMHLQPYTRLVAGLLELDKEKKDFSGLRRRFAADFNDPHHELTAIATAVSHMTETLEENFRLLETLSLTDKLTGLYNRRHIEEVLENEVNMVLRYNTLLGVIMLDIDHFKQINDTHGHLTGDRVLVELAGIIRSQLRSTDIVGRWGGEEFLVIFHGTSLAVMTEVAEKLRVAIAEAAFPKVGTATASFGLTVYLPGDTAESLVDRADKALYKAKSGGRNRVETA